MEILTSFSYSVFNISQFTPPFSNLLHIRTFSVLCLLIHFMFFHYSRLSSYSPASFSYTKIHPFSLNSKVTNTHSIRPLFRLPDKFTLVTLFSFIFLFFFQILSDLCPLYFKNQSYKRFA